MEANLINAEANLIHWMNAIQFASLPPAQFLIAGIWQGLLLTAMAWIGLKAFPKIAPSNRFLVWMTVFVLSALLPFSAAFHSSIPASLAAANTTSFRLPSLPASWAIVLVGLWVLAAMLSLARLFGNGFSLWRLSRSAVPAPPETLGSELRSILTKPGRRPIEVSLSRRVDSPIVIGFFRRAIVIPEWLSQRLTQAELKQVLLHELAHLERRDDWTNLLQKVFRALFPLNPALLFADRQLCREREMACDDAVLDASITPRSYASCLTTLAEKRKLQRAGSLAPGAWRGRSELAERVHRILDNHRQLGSVGATAAVAVLLLTFLPVGIVLARCPQLVAFSAISNPSPRPPSEARVFAPARFVQASLRTTTPLEEQPIRHRTPKYVSKRRAAAAPRVRQIERVQIERVEVARRMRDRDNSPLVFTLWEPVTSVSGSTEVDLDLFFPQISIFQSRTGWVVIQL